MTHPEVQAILQAIEQILTLRRTEHGRCRACGTEGVVFSVNQPNT